MHLKPDPALTAKRNIQVRRAFSCSKSEISNTAVDLKLWSVDHQRPGECLLEVCRRPVSSDRIDSFFVCLFVIRIFFLPNSLMVLKVAKNALNIS